VIIATFVDQFIGAGALASVRFFLDGSGAAALPKQSLYLFFVALTL
jgi:hypothetical protein